MFAGHGVRSPVAQTTSQLRPFRTCSAGPALLTGSLLSRFRKMKGAVISLAAAVCARVIGDVCCMIQQPIQTP